MTSEPPRHTHRGPRADFGPYRPEAGGGRAWTRKPRDPGWPAEAEGVREAEVTLATFGYLVAAFLGPVIPLGIYLAARRISPFMRHHAVTALNLSLTWLVYAVCCLILGGVLLLDSLTAALAVTLPIALVLWLSMVWYLLRGIGAANRGELAVVPAWICAPIAR
jgi:uncharacterized Tic20 family protein